MHFYIFGSLSTATVFFLSPSTRFLNGFTGRFHIYVIQLLLSLLALLHLCLDWSPRSGLSNMKTCVAQLSLESRGGLMVRKYANPKVRGSNPGLDRLRIFMV